MRTRLNRRTVLKGLLGSTVVSVALPPLDIFFNNNGTAYASGAQLPLRFGIYFWGNGVRPDKWVPAGTGSGDAWALSEEMAPLAPNKDKLCVVSGLKVMLPNKLPHWSGAAGILSASLGEGRDNSHTMVNPTIDQVIASGLESQGIINRFRSIEYGAEANGGISYNGPNSLNPAETSPIALFERIFTDGYTAPGSRNGPDPKLGLRRSVLDAVRDQGRKLQTKLGSVDRARLEHHFDAIRDLETRIRYIEENPISLPSCPATLPSAPTNDFPHVNGRPQISAANQALTDIVALALACGQTQVFSNWITHPVNNLLFEGASSGHHQLTHDEPGDQPQVNKIVLTLMAELNRMLTILDDIPEGDGTLLDHILLFCTTDCSEGRIHSLDEYPIILAGGANGAIKQNHHVRSSTFENATKLLITLQQIMGMSVTEYGLNEARATTSFDGVLV